MKPFELYISYVSWGSEGKLRPVLVMSIKGGKAFVYSITSQYASKSKAVQAQFYKIKLWSEAGLDRQSYVDTTIRFPIPLAKLKSKISIGSLSAVDKKRFLDFLKAKK